jgi:leader peptidase (prepilin peptidase)/N-methyltransferase
MYIKFPFVESGMPLLQYIYFTLIGLFLIGIFFYDLMYFEIPEIFTFPAIVIIFICNIFFVEPGLSSMAIGGAIAGLFFGIQVLASKETWLGRGDTQVGILMGMLLGWQLLLLSLFITYIIGSIICLPFLICKKISKKSQIPFAPFMVTALFITIFFGEYLLNLYLNTLI